MKGIYMVLAAGLFALPSLYANTLAPGGTVSPDVFSNTSSYTLLDSVSGNGSGAGVNGTLSISYSEYVAADQNNSFCAGCLDFAIQVTNTSGANSSEFIESVSTSSFAGFLTDVGDYGSSGVAPDSVIRSGGDGLSIHFTFDNGGIGSGDSSDYLVVETNATHYIPGTVTVQDGATVDVAGFSPAVPEPMSMGLLGGGLALLGLFGMRRRRSVKR